MTINALDDASLVVSLEVGIGSQTLFPKLSSEHKSSHLSHFNICSKVWNLIKLKNQFRALNGEVTNNEPCLSPSTVKYLASEHCNKYSSDWTVYGLEVIQHVTNAYTGNALMNGSKTNKQLHFYCYAAFTSTKHGFLGNKKHIAILSCVESRIHSHSLNESAY
jgi:hypothetical protein